MEWDIFISYASEERPWVVENLFRPLSRCRTARGEHPRIFFDVDGIDVSQNWQHALSKAISMSRKVIPVYSQLYFKKPMCQWELGLFWTLDPNGNQQKINPVLIEPDSVNEIPIQYSLINYQSVRSADWFERLCKGLNLTIEQQPTVLGFKEQPPIEIAVNHTLPPVSVKVESPEGRICDEPVTISCEGAQLQGTLNCLMKNGEARFEDLSFGAPVADARITASARGCEAALSKPFSVLQPVAAPLQKDRKASGPSLIPCHGQVTFFAGGKRILVLKSEKAVVFDLDGNQMGPEHDIDSEIRIIKCIELLIVLVDWWGRVLALDSDGNYTDWQGPDIMEGLQIAGDVAGHGHRLYVGFWSGGIYQLDISGRKDPELLMNNENGVQLMAWAGEGIVVVDLNGNVIQFKKNRKIELAHISGTIHLLKAYQDYAIVAADEKLYHLQLDSRQIYPQDLPFSEVASVQGQSAYPVVINAKGMGVRFDAGLRYEVCFATGAGAVPLSADDTGVYCVLKNSDGSFSLLVRDRIVFTHLGETLAIAQDGKHFAVDEESGIRIIDEVQVQEWIEEKNLGNYHH